MLRKPGWCEHPALVDFFVSARNKPEDLYPSERRFLPWLASQGTTILDVGCAAGGFGSIWRHYRPEAAYTGVDFSEGLIHAARVAHPQDQFLIGHCADRLPIDSNAFEIVQALGWLHWELGFEAALRELWRVTSRYCFFDVRLREQGRPTLTGRQKIAYASDWDGSTVAPYIVVSWSEFALLLESLKPRRVFGMGYWGAPADTVIGIDERVCLSTFVLEKSGENDVEQRSVCLDSPLTWPLPASAGSRQVLSAASLDVLCPMPLERGRSERG